MGIFDNFFDNSSEYLLRERRKKLELAVENLKRQLLVTQGIEMRKEIQKQLYIAEDALDDELTANWHREYKPEFYIEQRKLWRDDIGRELKKEYDRIWNKMGEIDKKSESINRDPTNDELDIKGKLWDEYYMLGSLSNADGTFKTGIDLEKAQRMQEVYKFDMKVYNIKPDMGLFERKKKEYADNLVAQMGIREGSQEYKVKMADWIEKNTQKK